MSIIDKLDAKLGKLDLILSRVLIAVVGITVVLLLIAGLLALTSCDGEIPIPTPPPPPPTPEMHDCTKPTALRGFIPLKGGIPNRYVVVMRRDRIGVSSVKALSERYGAKGVVGLSGIGFAATMSAESAERAAQEPDVAWVQPEIEHHAFAVEPGLDCIDNRSCALDGAANFAGDGAGVEIMVLDTGVTQVPDLQGRLSPVGFSAHPGGPADQHGHGTHVASTAAGTLYGVAKKATVVSIRVLNSSGSGTTSQVVQGMQWGIDRARQTGKRAVESMSLGGPRDPAIDRKGCDVLAANIVLSVAAGNDYGEDPADTSPARILQALTIGAMDPRNKRVASFSNKGPFLDFFAPGVGTCAAWYQGGTRCMDGTSMATPHASGAAAAYLSLHPDAPASAVVAALVQRATADLLTGVGTAANRLLFAGE